MTDSPSVTWPSPASTTLPFRRTDKTVVDRISRFLDMSAIFDYNSAQGGTFDHPHLRLCVEKQELEGKNRKLQLRLEQLTVG